MENTIDQITLGFCLGFDLMVLWTSFQNQSQSKVMRNQNNCELLSTIKWKLLKYSLWELYTVYFSISKKRKIQETITPQKTWVKLALKSQNIRLCLATSSPPKIIFVGRRQLWPGYQWTKYMLLVLKKTKKKNHYLGYEIVMLLSTQEL